MIFILRPIQTHVNSCFCTTHYSKKHRKWKMLPIRMLLLLLLPVPARKNEPGLAWAWAATKKAHRCGPSPCVRKENENLIYLVLYSMAPRMTKR